MAKKNTFVPWLLLKYISLSRSRRT